MTDRPIIFSAPMVRALLDGRKTQDRRVLTPQPREDRFLGPEPYHPVRVDRRGEEFPGPAVFGIYGDEWGQRLPYAPGDRLWVREAMRFDAEWNDCKPSTFNSADAVYYEADAQQESRAWGDPFTPGRLRPSIHMPRWASRLTLTVTDVRVQRLQDISEADAVVEGVEAIRYEWWQGFVRKSDGTRGMMEAFGADGPPPDDFEHPEKQHYERSAVQGYQDLWNSLHGPDAWDANPWVAAMTFTVQRGNIDEVT